jgi:uncharacterized protein (TIGR02118 family)
MSSAKLIVAYPQPVDIDAFEKLYSQEHVPLAVAKLVGKTKIVATKIIASPQGKPLFYGVAEVHFPSLKVLEECAASAGGQGNPGECGEDFIGRTAGHHGRAGG